MLVSAAQWSESAVCIHISPPSWACLPPPIPSLQVITEPRAEPPMLYSRFPLAIYFTHGSVYMGLPSSSVVKYLPAMQEMHVRSLGQEDPVEEDMATHSKILAWRIPWTEELGGLQCIAWQKVGHNWSDWAWTPCHSLASLGSLMFLGRKAWAELGRFPTSWIWTGNTEHPRMRWKVLSWGKIH